MSPLAGLGSLLRVALRRDRIMLPAWLGSLLLFAYVSAVGTVDLYPSLASRTEFVDGRPWGDPRWWVFALAAVVAVVVAAAGYALAGRRDLGAGILPPRPGPAHAGAGMGGPVGLAWRLQRATFFGWLAEFVVLGLVVGSIASTISDLLGTSSAVTTVLADLGGGGQGVVDAVIAVYFGIMGLAASAYAVAATLRLRSEEAAGRVEPLLAASVGRVRWALSHLGVAVAGSAALLAAAGLVGGVVHGLRTADVATQLPRVLGAALVQIPAAWVLAGITIAVFGLAPRLVGAAWAALAAFLMLGQLGPLLRLPQWAMDLSPFTHLPKLPGGGLTAIPLIWLTVIAVGMAGAGLAGFRRRDLTS